jgi:hypothetical protein
VGIERIYTHTKECRIMDIWMMKMDDDSVEYFKDLESLSIWIAAFDEDKVESFTVEKVWVND